MSVPTITALPAPPARTEAPRDTRAAMFDDDDNPTHDPGKDQCKGGLKSCKLRFGRNNELNHGGFPAVSLIARS